jgi:hypothetical protein
MVLHAPNIHAPEVPALRLTAVPDGTPPYDGEAGGNGHLGGDGAVDAAGTGGTGGQLAGAGPAEAPAAPGMAAAPATGPGTAGSAGALARRFAQAIIETIAGTRPFRQVAGSATEPVQAQIKRLIPLLRTDSAPRIRRILTSRPATNVVEVTVIAGFGPRTRAVALRFEQLPGKPAAPGIPERPARWLCTDIETA